MKGGWYPFQRLFKFIEKIKQDLNKHIIQLVGNKLMTMDYNDFEKIYIEVDNIFSDAWSKGMESVKKELSNTEKVTRGKFQMESSLLSNPLQSRIEELKKLREEHKNFVELSQNFIISQEEELKDEETEKQDTKLLKEIENAYIEFSKVDVLDLSGKGEKKMD
jgi:predicted RND superfamily exporter protein